MGRLNKMLMKQMQMRLRACFISKSSNLKLNFYGSSGSI